MRGRINSNPDFDAVANYKGITKWSGQINQTGRISEFLRRAHTVLRTGRGAPVLLEVPSDVAMEQIEANPVTYTPVKSIKSSGDPADIKSVASRLIKAERPVLYVGQGVLWAQASEEHVRLAELLDAPVATTNSGKSAFPENHELALGAAGNTVTKMAR